MCSGRAREMLRVKIHKTIRGMGFGRRNLEFDFIIQFRGSSLCF